ncbi:MAG TPA: alkaline phosphatase family protein [Patescibacteria group bacterium]|nr:alkaline phosphatase family protein [Patescibacteria group bacterium]
MGVKAYQRIRDNAWFAIKRSINVVATLVLLSGGVLQAVLSQPAVASATQQFAQPCGNAGTPGAVHHVVWIWMENETYSKVIGSPNAPYQNQLASQCGVPTNMYNESHGSLINYMAGTNGLDITANSQFITHNDCSPNTTFCYSNAPSIFSQVDSAAGESWRGYAEDMPSNCYKANVGNYAVRHNPATYYPGLTDCAQFDVPMGSPTTQTGAFYSDVQSGTLPSFSFVAPNLIDDAHSSSTATGDAWLSQIIPTITSGANYQNGDTVIFITNDEGGAGTPDHVIGEDCANQSLAPSQPSCHIPTIVVAPYTQAGTQDGTFYTHYSMLRTTEELLGLPLLGQAANANSMTAGFNLGAGSVIPPTLQPVTGLTATPAGTSQINLTWNASALATSYAIQRNGVQVGTTTGTTFSDTGLNPATTYGYTIVASDGLGNYATSNTVSAATAAAGTTQWVGNQSVESGLTGWTGIYNSTSKSSQVAGGYDGAYSLRSINSGTTTGSNGFIDKPHWLDGTAGKTTVAGTTYTASVWVKADAIGQKLTLFIRELNPAGAAMNVPPYNVGTVVTAGTTSWFNLTEAYPAQGTGDSLSFYVSASNVAAGKGFNADLMSLTSPSGSTADTTPPSTPTNFNAIPDSQTQVDLSWTASPDADVASYKISRGGVPIGTTSTTSYIDAAATANTTYTYSITAVDTSYNASAQATTSATTPPVLGTPTGLHATTPSSTEADLQWTAATGATAYNVQRNGVTIGVATGTSYADTGLTASTTYSYVIVATDSFDGSTSSTPLQVITPADGVPPPPPAPLTLCGNTAPITATPIQHIVVVMFENKSYKQVVGNSSAPYQTSLTTTCGVATAMFGATHTSAANYLAISAGEFPSTSPPGCGSVKACADASNNLYKQLDTAGLNWRAYEESMPAPCTTSSSGAYKIGHNPPLFYSNIPAAECAANDLPVADLTAQSGVFWNDLQNQTLPSFSFVTPSLNNDGEGTGGLLAADNWLKNFLATVQQSNSYQAGNTLVLVTYDEGTGSDATTGEDCTNQSLDMPITNNTSAHQDSCHVPFFVVYPYTPAGTSDGTFFDHYSVTKTVESEFGLPLLAHAGDAQTTSLIGHFGIN